MIIMLKTIVFTNIIFTFAEYPKAKSL